MKYLSIPNIVNALNGVARLNDQNSNNHLASQFVSHYFPAGRFTNTNMLGADHSSFTPVNLVDKLEGEISIPHAMVISISTAVQDFAQSVRDLVNSELFIEFINGMGEIGAQYTIHVIMIINTNIAFFEYLNYASLLEDSGIENYEGLIPLNKVMTVYQFKDINSGTSDSDYLQYLLDKNAARLNLSNYELVRMGVNNSVVIHHPHILDLLNAQHENYVHDLFVTAGNHKAGHYIQD